MVDPLLKQSEDAVRKAGVELVVGVGLVIATFIVATTIFIWKIWPNL